MKIHGFRARKNKENMENLQTLLKELTYIEESNEALNKELDSSKEREKLLQVLKTT